MLNVTLFLLVLAMLCPQKEPLASWHVTGTMSEACTCSPPCTCNFNEDPTPHNFCYAIAVYTIKEGVYKGVKLDGLQFGGVQAQGGKVLYLDERATPSQRPALERLARLCIRSGLGPDDLGQEDRKKWKAILYTRFRHEVSDRANFVQIGDMGGFRANYIMGRDHTRPIVVENIAIWPLERAIKAKTLYLKYKDRYGNELDFAGTNSNQGDFRYDEKSRL